MKFIRRALVSAIAAVALIVCPAVSAEAATMSFDVTKLSAKNMVVSNGNCKYFDVHMKYKKSKVDSWDVEADIAGRHGSTTSAYFGNYHSPSTKDRAMICPSLEGLGKYRIGPSEISADYDDANYNSHWYARTDYTKGSFYVRGKTYASLASKRSGKTVTLTSTTKVYNPEKYGKVTYNPKVKFRVKSGSKWKTIKTVTAKKGKATYKVKTKSKKTYRVTFGQISWATGATSKTVKR